MRSSRDNVDCASSPPSVPPELPVKLRVKSHPSSNRPTSQYDNLTSTDYYSQTSASFSSSSLTGSQNLYHRNSSYQEQHHHGNNCGAVHPVFPPPSYPRSRYGMVSVHEESENVTFRRGSASNKMPGDNPPPLPPKKKNIMAYVQNVSSSFYEPTGAFEKMYRASVHAHHRSQKHQNKQVHRQLEMSFLEQYNNSGSSRSFCESKYSASSGSDESMLSTSSSAYNASSTVIPPYNNSSTSKLISTVSSKLESVPPLLPPKKSLHQGRDSINSKGDSNSCLSATSLPVTRSSSPLRPGPPSDSSSGISSQSGGSSPTHSTAKPPPAKAFPTKSTSSSSTNTITSSPPTTNHSKGPLDSVDMTPWLAFKNQSEDGPEIKGGTVDALIVKATEVSKSDILFVEAFLTTYRTFISSKELIDKLMYRYNKFLTITDTRQKVAINAFALLVRVVDDLCINDCTEDVMKSLSEFVHQMANRGNSTLARLLKDKTSEKMNRRTLLNVSPIHLPSLAISTKVNNLTDFKSKAVAEQMSLLDLQLFVKIEVAEVLIWAKEQKEDLIPNLTKFTEHFNNVSYWARTQILKQEEARDREKVVSKLIKIIKHLRKLNNFNSFLAIVSALDSAPVRRLEWSRTVIEEIQEHSSLIDSSSSFKAYRQVLADAEPPCIPYIGLILQDLTFVDQGNCDLLADGKINFDKRWKLFYRLDEMRRFRSSHYPFKRNDAILSYFNNFDDYLHEESMWQISEAIKPRPKK